MQCLSRRQKAGRAVWMLSWVALLAWGSAARTFENSSSALEGVFARDNNITEVAKLHAGAKRLMREMTTTTDEFFWQKSEDIMKFSLSVPGFMWNKRERGGDTDHGYSARQGVYNFALLSWGPGFIYYVVIAPKWTGPNCLFTHYTRRFKSNYTQNQPVWMRDALSCHTVSFLRMHNVMYIHYPDVPCPNFFYGNYMCHIIGDHVAVQPWEKWADYALYVDVLYTSYSGDRERIPYELGFGRKYYPVRIHTCDPTRDCLSFPRKNWSSIGFDFSTTPTSTAAPTTKYESTTTLPPAIETLPPIRRKSVKMVCPTSFHRSKPPEYIPSHAAAVTLTSGRTIEERLREHIRDFKFKKLHRSAAALHAWATGHDFLFDKAKVLASEDRWWPRRIKEALEIVNIPRTSTGTLDYVSTMRGLHHCDVRGRGRPPVRTVPRRPIHELPDRSTPSVPPPPFTLHSVAPDWPSPRPITWPISLYPRAPNILAQYSPEEDCDMSIETSASQPSTRRHPDSPDHDSGRGSLRHHLTDVSPRNSESAEA